jgi:YfiH family protein
MEHLLICPDHGLEMSRFPSLNAGALVHGVFGRRGGVSRPPYDSLNVSFGVGDDPDLVRANRALLKQALTITTLVSARQVHGDRVLVVDAGPAEDIEADGYDALITKGRAGLMIQQADCQAVIIHDPATPALGLAHAGWRGSVADIVGITVRAMTAAFGSTPAQLLAAISPALGPCCAEFVNYRQELPSWMHEFQVRPNYFDFPAITVQQLLAAGLRRENISKAGVCTRCNSAYYSYRRSRITGRFATVAALRGRY